MPVTSSGLYGGEPSPIPEVVERPIPVVKHKAGRPKGSPNKQKKPSLRERGKLVKEVVKVGPVKVALTNEKVLGIYKTHPDVPDVSYGTNGSACFDLRFSPNGKNSYTVYDSNNGKKSREFSSGKLVITPGDTVMVPTGLIFSIPTGYSVRVYNRSSVPLKRHLFLVNAVGVIDEDYTDECMILLYNAGTQNQTIEPGDRIAQAELVPVNRPSLLYLADPPVKVGNRNGGYGSTGV